MDLIHRYHRRTSPGLFNKRKCFPDLVLARVFVFVLVSGCIVRGQESLHEKEDLTAGKAFSLELIMSDQDWLGRQPENPYWGDGSEHFYYSQKRPGSTVRDLYRASAVDKAQAIRVTPNHAAEASVAGGDWRYDPKEQRFVEKVYIREGDVYHRDLTTGVITQLTRTTSTERQPLLLTDGSIGFRRGDTFLVRDIGTGLEYEPFPFVFKKSPDEQKLDEEKKATLLARKEERLFDIIKDSERDRNLQEVEQQLKDKEDPALTGTPFYLGDEFELGSATMSPSGKHLALVLLPKKRPKPSQTKMPSWVTHSGEIETRDVRSRVGTVKPYHSKLMLLNRDTRTVVEVVLDALTDIAKDPVEDLRMLAEKREKDRNKQFEKQTGPVGSKTLDESPDDQEKQPEESKGKILPADSESKPRAVEFRSLLFNQDGSGLIFQAVSFDNKDRWIVSVDLESGDCRTLHHLHDSAWINWRHNEYGWSRDGSQVWYLSEETGYAHLYLVDVTSIHSDGHDGPMLEAKALTEGRYIVTEPQLSVDGEHVYFRANKEHPGQYEIYRVALKNGQVEQITNLGGMSSATLSPDGTQLLITHSTAVRPPELFVQPARPSASAEQRTDTVSEAFMRRSWIAPKHVEVPSSHGAPSIHSRLYLPPDTSLKKRPAVFFVHGAGYLQNAHKGWSGYSREFMFHSFLAEKGFVVLDMDYRASAGYGRDWRTAIYRHMGSVELEDLRDGVNWLVEHHDVDRDQIGVYGGSYGGFLTLMALFNEPDLFAAGAALRPVTDWAHYNHGYTSRILNTPELDPEAYRRSSPIEFASGLRKPLLICAPMLDDNVFFQDSVRLVQRLIELEKQNWWIAIYPVEPHGFKEPSSWLDEYRRIWDLFERYLID
jgi:dipeptidyl aminopeptidase/acylaminoacyl peptidase